MSQVTDDIKSRLDIVELISTYLTLKKSGASFKACCPFHQEKTPSFYVSRDKNMWYCFGCNEGGDIFSFVQKLEGMDFPEALKLLADKAGVRLPEYKPEEEQGRARLYAIMDLGARYFRHCLTALPEGEAGRSYVSYRSISDNMSEAFTLGYAPAGWENLTNFLRSKKYTDQEIALAGLSIQRDRGTGSYDRFRRRLMFPIRDVHGRIVAFTGRLLPPEDKDPNAGGKYVNSPETPLYKKSAILYGLDRAWREIKSRDKAILVEGNTDVIACHQAGMTNVVASSGTALTAEQVRLLSRYTTNLVFAFDADPAGNTAALRGIEIATEAGMHLSVTQVPEGAGKDAAEIIQKDPAMWSKIIETAIPYLDYAIRSATKNRDLSRAEEKSKVASLILPLIAKIPDAVEVSHWLQELDKVLRVGETALREQMHKIGKIQEPKNQEPIRRPTEMTEHLPTLEEHFLGILLVAPKQLSMAMARVLPEYLSPQTAALYTKLVMAYNRGAENCIAALQESLNQEQNQEILQLFRYAMMRGERDVTPLGDNLIEHDLRATMTRILDAYRTRRRDVLSGAMREAEMSGDRSAVDEVMKQFHELI